MRAPRWLKVLGVGLAGALPLPGLGVAMLLSYDGRGGVDVGTMGGALPILLAWGLIFLAPVGFLAGALIGNAVIAYNPEF